MELNASQWDALLARQLQLLTELSAAHPLPGGGGGGSGPGASDAAGAEAATSGAATGGSGATREVSIAAAVLDPQASIKKAGLAWPGVLQGAGLPAMSRAQILPRLAYVPSGGGGGGGGGKSPRHGQTPHSGQRPPHAPSSMQRVRELQQRARAEEGGLLSPGGGAAAATLSFAAAATPGEDAMSPRGREAATPRSAGESGPRQLSEIAAILEGGAGEADGRVSTPRPLQPPDESLSPQSASGARARRAAVPPRAPPFIPAAAACLGGWLTRPPPAPHLPHAPEQRPNAGRICTHCGTTKTPQWREGPAGPKTLCNACGIRFLRTRCLGKPGAAPGGKKGGAGGKRCCALPSLRAR